MRSDPLILAFDTSAAHCAAALLSGGTVLAEAREDMAKGQAERLMPLVEHIMDRGGAALPDLAAIGVGIGPGNFTGIRISVAAARGLAVALGIPAVGVSGLEAMAFGTKGPVLCCLDARRDHVYLQRFGPGVARGPALMPLGQVSDWACDGLRCIGHDAETLAARLGATPAPARHPLAVAIARVAAPRRQAGGPRPAPLYLRAPDAAPARDTGPAMLP